MPGDTYNDSMTVAAFKQKVSEYCNDIDQAMKDYEDAVKAQKEAQDAYDEAKVAYDEAKEAYDASLLEPSAKPTSKPTVLPSSSVPVLPQAVKPVIKANKTTVKVGIKKQTVTIKVTATNGSKVTYTISKTPSGAKKYISISKNGKLTIKKGAKAGTYKIKVKVKSTNGTVTSKTISIKVKK